MPDCGCRLKTLAERYPKYGCPTLHDMLVIEGEVENHKRTYRIYCEEGLQVRTKKRKKTRPAACADAGAGCRQPALVDGLRLRSAGQRPPLPRAQRR